MSDQETARSTQALTYACAVCARRFVALGTSETLKRICTCGASLEPSKLPHGVL